MSSDGGMGSTRARACEVWTSPAIDDVGVVIHEHWQVVDRWWTDEPTYRWYRDVTRDGSRRVEMREGELGEWEVMEGYAHAS